MSTVIGIRGIRKVFLAVSSMIVTGFLIKSYRKLREKPREKPDTEEVYRLMRAAYARVRRRAAAMETFNRMPAISTPRDGGLMSPIDTLQQMAPGRFA